MFKNKKILQDIEIAKKELEQQKAELQFIKAQMTDTSPKIDITYVHVFRKHGINYFAKLYIEPGVGENGFGVTVKGYRSKLVDIFTNQVIHEKHSIDPLQREETIYEQPPYIFNECIITCTPICEVIPELLAYPDKQVPEYVLKQAYYNLNNVNVNSKILRKEK